MRHSVFLPKLEQYHWTFDGSSTTDNFDILKQKAATLTGARIPDTRPSLLIEEEGQFVTELSGDKGVTVSFSMKQAGKSCFYKLLKN